MFERLRLWLLGPQPLPKIRNSSGAGSKQSTPTLPPLTNPSPQVRMTSPPTVSSPPRIVSASSILTGPQTPTTRPFTPQPGAFIQVPRNTPVSPQGPSRRLGGIKNRKPPKGPGQVYEEEDNSFGGMLRRGMRNAWFEPDEPEGLDGDSTPPRLPDLDLRAPYTLPAGTAEPLGAMRAVAPDPFVPPQSSANAAPSPAAIPPGESRDFPQKQIRVYE